MKVRNLTELNAMQKSGAIKAVEGMHFVEPQAPPAPAPAQAPSIEPLVAAIRESMEKQTALSQEHMQAMYRLILSLSRTPQAAPLAPKPRRWVFTIEKDEDGFTKQIIAEASE